MSYFSSRTSALSHQGKIFLRRSIDSSFTMEIIKIMGHKVLDLDPVSTTIGTYVVAGLRAEPPCAIVTGAPSLADS
jgi:hypothetical protein